MVVIVGPTGAGKSELSLVLAQAFGGEIVGCDSVQVYRGLDVGSAKLAAKERRGIRHHLIDILDPDQELTAGGYSRMARDAISAIQAKGSLPIVVGGTGFYLRALVEGLSPAPARDENLRSRLNEVARRRPFALHRFLRRQDPEASARIHANDHQKLIRAIEMTWLMRQPATKIQNLERDRMQGIVILKIGLNPTRSALYRHLDARSAWIFRNGLLAETRALLDSGVSPGAKPLESLGYKQAVKVLGAQMPVNEAMREYQTKTRQYAKRQLTWFRAQREVHWLNDFGTAEVVQRQAVELTRKFLNSTEQISEIAVTD